MILKIPLISFIRAQNSMQLLFTEYALWGAYQAYKRLPVLVIRIFSAFRRFSYNSIITICPNFFYKATGSPLKLLMNRTTSQSNVTLNQSPEGRILSILSQASCSFSRADASLKEARCQGCGGCLSSTSGAAGVEKRKHCTARPTPGDVSNVKKHAHCATQKIIQAARGVCADRERCQIFESISPVDMTATLLTVLPSLLLATCCQQNVVS